VRTEIRVRHCDQVILATGPRPGTWQALHRDPARRLQPRLGKRLIAFPLTPGVHWPAGNMHGR